MPEWIPVTEIIIGVIIASVPALIGVGIWIGSVNSDRSNFKEFMKEIRDKIAENNQQIRENNQQIRENNQQIRENSQKIRENLQLVHQAFDQIRELNDKFSRIFYRLISEVESKGSPIHLTDLGKSISQQLGAVAWVEEIASIVKNQVKGKDEYQIQTFSFNYMSNENQYTDEQRGLIRKVAFDNSIYEDEVYRVLALELRDVLITTMLEGES